MFYRHLVTLLLAAIWLTGTTSHQALGNLTSIAGFPESPPGNPVLPANVQSFTPPPPPGASSFLAPKITSFTKVGGADDTLALVGHDFSRYDQVDFGKDSRFVAYAQTNGSNGIQAAATVQKLDGPFAAITLPSTLPADALVFLWAQNDAGSSPPMILNRTEAWWVGPDAAEVGGTASVYGINLASGPKQETSHVYLVPRGATTGVWVTVTEANPYKVDFQIPASFPAGPCEVWIHNGRGGAFGWSTPRNLDLTPMTLEARRLIGWKGPVFNVRDAPFLAAGDGTRNDSIAIQAALDAAAAHALAKPAERPTVLIPAGTYTLFEPLNAVSNVRLMGDAPINDHAWLTRLVTAEPPRAAFAFSGNSEDLSRNENHGTVGGNLSIRTDTSAGWKSPFGGLAFNGGGALSLPDSDSLFFSGPLTLAARIKDVVSPPGSPAQYLFAKSADQKSIFARIRNGIVEFGFHNGITEVIASTPLPANSGATGGWTTLVFTHTGSSLEIFDGQVLRASVSERSGLPKIRGRWRLGANPEGTGGFLTGKMDMARIYARSLSPLEREMLFKASRDSSFIPALISTPLPVTSFEVDGVEIRNSFSHFINQIPYGTSVVELSGNDITLRNIQLDSGPFRGFSIGSGSVRFQLIQSKISANTNYSRANQVIIQEVDFFGKGDAEQLLVVDGGSTHVSISKCSGQDFANDGTWTNSAGGRFVTGSVGGGSQRFFYIGNNMTRDLAPRTGKSDQNAGEQILWDQNSGNLIHQLVSARGSDFLDVPNYIGSNSLSHTDSIVVAGGTGIGQSRRIVGINPANGRVTIDRPWDVVPDPTSIVLFGKEVSKVVVYKNRLDGKSDYATRTTASSGINFFNNGSDVIVDFNEISEVRSAVNFNGVKQGDIALPVHNTTVLNNKIDRVLRAFTLSGGTSTLSPAVIASVWRNNLIRDVQQSGIEANVGALHIFERNTFEHLPFGVSFNRNGSNSTRSLVLRANSFNRGNAALTGSIGIVMSNDLSIHVDPVITGNVFTNFENEIGNTSNNLYSGRYFGMATANDGKIYGVMNTTLNASPADVIQSFDPSNPLQQPLSFLQGSTGGLNGHLQGTKVIHFTNTQKTGSNTKPINCKMYLANSKTGSVSSYTFNSVGAMTYHGEIVSNLGSITDLTTDSAGNLYILIDDANPNLSGAQPKLHKWNGSTLVTLIDSPLFRYGSNVTVRPPTSVFVDPTGQIYIAMPSGEGFRRFTPTGGLNAEFPVRASSIKGGLNGTIHVLVGKTIRVFNPVSGVASTVLDASKIPSVANHSSILSFTLGPPAANDVISGGVPSYYFSTSGAVFLAAYGPGAATAGTQVALRDNLTLQLQIPIRTIATTADATASLEVANTGLIDARFSVSSSSPWLRIQPGRTANRMAEGSIIVAQSSTPVSVAADISALNVGVHQANITVNYNNLGLTQPRVITASVIVTVAEQHPWMQQRGVPRDTSWNDDIDGDGHSLIMEYALGGNPNSTDQSLIQAEHHKDGFQISFLWNVLADDLHYRVEGSSNLQSWETLLSRSPSTNWTGRSTFLMDDGGTDLVWMTVKDIATAKHRFMRVRVEMQAPPES